MTTYVVNFTLPEAETNIQNTQYPILVGDSTYLPDCTIFVKAGDTIRYTVNQVDGGSNTGNVIYQDTTNKDTDPDPDGVTGNNQTKTSPGSWEYTVGTGNEDKFFTWFFYGSVSATNPANKKYSQRVQTVRVDGAPRINYGTSAVNVNQGGSLTFSISGMGMYHEDNGAQLDSASNLNKNKLYFAVFDRPHGSTNPNPSVVLVQNYTNGGWVGSTNQLGKIWTSSQTVTLNIGDNMPTGTYYAYLTHYNPLGTGGDLANASSSPIGNPFYGSENRLGPNGSSHGNSAAALQFTVQAPTGTNTTPSLGDNINAGTNLSYPVDTNSGTITCDPTTFQPDVFTSNTTGSAAARFRLKNSNGTYPTTSYTGVGTTLQLTSGQSVDFKMTGPSGYSDTTTGRLTIGSVFDELSVTTSAAADDSDTDALVDTSSDWGLIIKNDAGNQIFGTGQKQGHVLVAASYSGTVASNGTSNPITIPGIIASENIPGRTAILIIDKQANTGRVNWIVNRTSNATTFTVYNGNAEARTFDYIVLRH